MLTQIFSQFSTVSSVLLASQPLKPLILPRKGNVEIRVPAPAIRKKLQYEMMQSQAANATLTTFNKIDCTTLIDAWGRWGKYFKTRHNVELGILPAFMKACCVGLEEFPSLNSYIDDQAKEIVYRKNAGLTSFFFDMILF